MSILLNRWPFFFLWTRSHQFTRQFDSLMACKHSQRHARSIDNIDTTGQHAIHSIWNVKWTTIPSKSGYVLPPKGYSHYIILIINAHGRDNYSNKPRLAVNPSTHSSPAHARSLSLRFCDNHRKQDKISYATKFDVNATSLSSTRTRHSRLLIIDSFHGTRLQKYLKHLSCPCDTGWMAALSKPSIKKKTSRSRA